MGYKVTISFLTEKLPYSQICGSLLNNGFKAVDWFYVWETKKLNGQPISDFTSRPNCQIRITRPKFRQKFRLLILRSKNKVSKPSYLEPLYGKNGQNWRSKKIHSLSTLRPENKSCKIWKMKFYDC